MNATLQADPSARVRMRTDGPPVPIYRNEDPPACREESFLSMARRRSPWVFLIGLGAVLMGGLLGQALVALA
ncbi:hypothetical protein [Roseateles sp. P5_E1]